MIRALVAIVRFGHEKAARCAYSRALASAGKDDVQWLGRARPGHSIAVAERVPLPPQSRFDRFLPGQLGQHTEFFLHVLPRNPVPQSVFEFQHVHLLLLNPKDLSVRKPNQRFPRAEY